METIKLSKNFRLSEFAKSETAARMGLNNYPPKSVINNLKNLCETVLQPLRSHFGVPIVISSGYRCAALNAAVGGVPNSQHKFGEAADIHIPLMDVVLQDGKKHTDREIATRWLEWIRDNTDFDQLILETSNGMDFWIHVSCRPDHKRNRHQVIYYKVKG